MKVAAFGLAAVLAAAVAAPPAVAQTGGSSSSAKPPAAKPGKSSAKRPAAVPPKSDSKKEEANAAATGSPTALGQYGDWGAYTATHGGHKVCFTLAKPASSETTPPGRKRDQAYLFVATRPAENVKD